MNAKSTEQHPDTGRVGDERLDKVEEQLEAEHERQSDMLYRLGSDERPKSLYHYTDGVGLIGIISTRQLWASNVLHLNDASETTYPMATAQGIAEELLGQERETESRSFKDFLEVVPYQMDATASSHEKYVVCFCDHDDLLSQWRAYSHDSVGYAIGFAAEPLSNGARGPHEQRHAILTRALYDDDLLRELVHSSFEQIRKSLEWIDATDPDEPVREAAIGRSLNWLEGFVIIWALHFKHPGFAEEREWRLTYPVFQEDEPSHNFRPAAGQVLPYIHLSFTQAGQTGYLPLSDVVCGPSSHDSLTRSAVELLLNKHGYPGGVTVRSSGVPLRA